MISYLARRTPSVITVLVITSMIAFALPRLAPGDPAAAAAGPDASQETIDAIRTEMNLDRPLVEQYLEWIGGALTGDLGTSFINRRPVTELIGDRIGSTLELTALAAVLMIALGILLGVVSALARRESVRLAVDGLVSLMLASPPFLSGLLLMLLFGVALPVLPISGEVSILEDPWAGFTYLILPAFALALPQSATIARLLSSSLRTVQRAEFIDLAQAKGLGRRRIVRKHMLRNGFGPALVIIGLRLAELLAGAIVIEAIFGRHGLGSLAITSVQARDYLVLQALILGAVFVAIVMQLLTDVGVALLDPRIRLSR